MYNIPNPYDPEEYQPTDINLPKLQSRHNPNKPIIIGTVILCLIISLWIVPFAIAESQASSIHAISITPTTIQSSNTTPGSLWQLFVTFPTPTPTAQPTQASMVTTNANRPIPTSCSNCGQSAQPSPVATIVVTPTVEPTATPQPTPTATAIPSPTMIPTATPTQLPTVEPTPAATVAPAPTDTPVPTNPPTAAPTQPPATQPAVPTSAATAPQPTREVVATKTK